MAGRGGGSPCRPVSPLPLPSPGIAPSPRCIPGAGGGWRRAGWAQRMGRPLQIGGVWGGKGRGSAELAHWYQRLRPPLCPQQNFEPAAGGRRCGRLGGRVGVAEPCVENGLWAAYPARFEPGGCEEEGERGGLFAVHPPSPCEQPRGQTGLGLGGVPWDSPRRGQLKRGTSFALPDTKISFSFSCQICHFRTES